MTFKEGQLLWWRVRYYEPVRVRFVELNGIRSDYAQCDEVHTGVKLTVRVQDLYEEKP